MASGLAVAACSVPQDAEVAIGQADAARADSQLPMLRDTMADRFVTDLGQSMASKPSRADLSWHFAVVNSPEVNAFALPGGYIFVNRGAIEQADRSPSRLSVYRGRACIHVRTA
jgi:predicted Zn-dependent protease